MASLCRLRATFEPTNAWRWLARAHRWESLADAEIEEHYRECNANNGEAAAA
jgi:hypothetical protein